MNTSHVAAILACGALLGGTSSVYAEGETQGDSKPSFRVGEGLRFEPAATLAVGYDSNVTSRNANEIDSWFTALTAGGTLTADTSQTASYTLSASISAGSYESSSADNYLDASLIAGADWKFGPKAELTAQAEYLRGHDARGASTRVVGAEPDTWDQVGVIGQFNYGREGSQGRIELNAGYHDKYYDDFAAGPAMTEDKEFADLGATFYYRVGPRTEVFVETAYRNTDFDVNGLYRDNETYSLRGGVAWNATSKTEGRAKIGYTEKDYNNPAAKDPSAMDWQLELIWTPTERDNVNLSTRRSLDESTGTGNYVKATDYRAAWSHNWTKRISSSVGVGYSETVYDGVARTDDLTLLDASLEYAYSKLLSFGGMVSQESRDSNLNANDYDRSIVGVYVKSPSR